MEGRHFQHLQKIHCCQERGSAACCSVSGRHPPTFPTLHFQTQVQLGCFSGWGGTAWRGHRLKNLTAINKVVSFSASSCLQSLVDITQQNPLVRNKKAVYDYSLPTCLSDCSSTVFCSGPWSQHHPSLLPTMPSLTIQLRSLSLSPPCPPSSLLRIYKDQ